MTNKSLATKEQAKKWRELLKKLRKQGALGPAKNGPSAGAGGAHRKNG